MDLFPSTLSQVPILEAVNAARRLYGAWQHQFSIGVLRCYYMLGDKKVAAEVVEGDKLVLRGGYGKRREKWFCFNVPPSGVDLSDKSIAVFSQHGADGMKKRKEVAYDLDLVFNSSSYANAKKRYQRLTYPQKFFDKNGLSLGIAVRADFDAIRNLHEDWVQAKLDDPKTFKLSFTPARYRRCVAAAEQNSSDYLIFVVKKDDSIIAARVVDVSTKGFAYDLAFFSNREISNLNENFEMLSLRYLWEEMAVKKFNSGDPLNKNLQAFKQHIPSTLVEYWTN